MKPFSPDGAALALSNDARQALREISSAVSDDVKDTIAGIVREEAGSIADVFYTVVLSHEVGKNYVEHEIVHKRLRTSMQAWLLQVFGSGDEMDVDSFVARQIEVGAVHARIKLPPQLMQMGTRILCRELRERISRSTLGSGDMLVAQMYVSDIFSLADGLMITAYVRDLQRSVRADEAYRHVAVRHDAGIERERQRAFLSEWVNDLLFSIRLDANMPKPRRLSDSEFGMWLKHKARVLFDGVTDAGTIFDTVANIDETILPVLSSDTSTKEMSQRAYEELKRQLDFLRYLLGDLFDRLSSIDQGRDSVTGLYNRRHLDAVLAREQEEHARTGKPFGVLLLRVDGVDHAARSDDSQRSLLQQFAAVLVELARAGDHLFRYGTSDFLILAVEASAENLREVGENLRRQVKNHRFHLREDAIPRITVSIGAAQFDGHPDFLRILRKAEGAVIQAVVDGGDRLVLK